MRAVACGRIAIVVSWSVATLAGAAPVEVYREGPEFCPRDRPATAARLTPPQAIERARSLVPKGFCSLSRFVAGCDADGELIDGTWRIFLQQYQLRGYRHDPRGLGHTYVILDSVGNCLANIPGTEPGSRE